MSENNVETERTEINPAPNLTWTLAICTYNRPNFLTQTLEFALSQSRPPIEIVVVDASDDWDAHRDLVTKRFADHWAGVRLVYVAANVRSITYQRNQAMGLATSEIVFSIDDDIYMFQDAAEQIMGIYEADPDHEISMVAGHFTSYGPGTENLQNAQAAPSPSVAGQLRTWVEGQMTLDGHFVPYGEEVDRSPLPPSVRAAGGSVGGLINGGRTTVRRNWATETGWSEQLRYY